MTSRTARRLVGGIALALLAFGAQTAIGSPLVDGTLPPLPYRYLHPPPALKGTNQPPLHGVRVLPLDYLRASSWLTFTGDTQAGISGPETAFVAPSGTTAITLRLDPVETPLGLPSEVAPDSNAYRIQATAQPSGKQVGLRKAATVILRWPHLPTDLYRFSGGKYSRVCSSEQAVITSNRISCKIRELGIFVVATTPSNSSFPFPRSKPQTTTTTSPLRPFIPLVIVIALVALAALVAAFFWRPERS